VEDIVGRAAELEALERWLDRPQPSALLIEGGAGIGKTTLWRRGVELADERGWRVLTASPAASEARLPFSAIGDLLEAAVSDVAAQLPPPQRHALEVALLLKGADGRPPDERAVAVAVLAALRALARDNSLLVAVDDVQWLDRSSADALAFVARRLEEPVALLVAERRDEPGSVPLELDRAFTEPLARVELGPLSLGAIHRLLRSNLGLTFTRPALRRVHNACGGNPFFALEIGRVVKEQPDALSEDAPLRVPADVAQLVRQRIERLSRAGRDAVLAAALQPQPTETTVELLSGRDGLEEAMAAGVLVVESKTLRFAHPLFAEAAMSLTPSSRRRDMHLRLAELLDDTEARGRHLALGASEPSASVAAAIDAGAAAAAARGAPSAAAELAEAASRLTPPSAPADAVRRRLDAADWHQAAGDARAARLLLEPLALASRQGPERARILIRLAAATDPSAGVPMLEQACEEAAGDLHLMAEAQLGLAQNLLSAQGARADLIAAVRAEELAVATGNVELITEARGKRLLAETLAGERVEPETVAWASGRFDAYRDHYPPAVPAALWLMYRDRLDEARAVLGELAQNALERGEEDIWATASLHLAEVECRAGRYATASGLAEQVRTSELGELDQPLSAVLYVAACADAYRGRVEAARAGALRGLELAEGVGDTFFAIQNEGVLGFLDLSLGNAGAAAARLAPLWPRLVGLGYGEPSAFPVLPNAIHALLETGGDRPEVERLLEQLEERGHALDSAWALSQAARLRALLAADEGSADTAVELLDRALVVHERMPGPFERARTLLARGIVLRRARRKRDARAALEQALAIFEELGTPLWAAKAKAEIGRLGGRRTHDVGELTPTEARVAKLVAEGKSNKEVAAELVVSIHTVEAALTSIYRKLGVRSRTEMARKLVETAGSKH
jgi:DNA-binding CsgD family transcriptional regulator